MEQIKPAAGYTEEEVNELYHRLAGLLASLANSSAHVRGLRGQAVAIAAACSAGTEIRLEAEAVIRGMDALIAYLRPAVEEYESHHRLIAQRAEAAEASPLAVAVDKEHLH